MRKAVLSASAALCVVLGACSDSGTGPDRVPSGATSVLLTDAPFPYDSVASVDLYVLSIAASPVADTSEANTNWVTIAEPHRAFDFLDLRNGATALAGAAEIPAGEYRAVRVMIDTDSSAIIKPDGAPAVVDWQSSAGRPTLYAFVERPLAVPQEGGSIVIDFDVGRSFLCLTSTCPPFTFSPVLRAVEEAATGSISGTVTGDTPASDPTPIAFATITVLSGDPSQPEDTWAVRATGQTDAHGAYVIPFLNAGTYIIRAEAPRGSDLPPAVRSNVVVRAEEETTGQDIELQYVGLPGALPVDSTVAR